MKVLDLMTEDPAFCLPSDPAQKASRLMIENDCGLIPIVDDPETRRVIGVITDRDLSNCIVASGKDSRKVRLEDCMTSQVITCGPDDEIEQVLDLMKENQIRRVPCVDGNARLIGVVAQADIHQEMQNVDREKVGEALEGISRPTGVPSRTRERFSVPEEASIEEGLGESEEEESEAPELRPAVKTARRKKTTARRSTRSHRGRGTRRRK